MCAGNFFSFQKCIIFLISSEKMENKDGGITIPREVFEKVKSILTEDYNAKFGDTSKNSNTERLSKDEFVRRYAENILFWKERTPELQPNMSIENLARHAITTNAVNRLNAYCAEKGVIDEVSDWIAIQESNKFRNV